MNVLRHARSGRQALVVVALSLMLGACASTPPPKSVDESTPAGTPASQTTANPLAISDPAQGLNRRVYRFNALTERYVLLPVVHVYDRYTPGFMRTGIANFFSNISEITTFTNTVLQLKPKSSAVTASRFVINSTVGIGGLFDPATHMGCEQRDEDFGQTLGHYGVGTGPYLVLPFLGRSDLRDAGGLAADQGCSMGSTRCRPTATCPPAWPRPHVCTRQARSTTSITPRPARRSSTGRCSWCL